MSDEDCKHIVMLVNSYFEFQVFEDKAADLRDVVAHLKAVARQAGSLYQRLGPGAGGIDSEIRSYALEQIAANYILMREPDGKARNATGLQVMQMAAGLMIASKVAAQNLAKEKTSGFKKRSAWKQLMWSLMEWAEGRGLEVTTASAGMQKTWPSPFVQFVHNLQVEMPEPMREYTGSLHTLTDALDAIRAKRAARNIAAG